MAIKNIQHEDITKVPESQKLIFIAPDLQAVLAFLLQMTEDCTICFSLFSRCLSVDHADPSL